MSALAVPWPESLRFKRGAKVLNIHFDDGKVFSLPFQYLREKSPSAEIRGHGGQKPPPIKISPDISIERAEPVGNYAVRIIFDDGHDSGLYTWCYLRELGALVAADESDRRIYHHG